MTKPDQPLRILMLAPTPYFSDRGCHVRIYEEARALLALGHQVRIVAYHLGRDLPPVPVDRTLAVPWYRKQGAGPSWHKPYLDLLLLLTALRVARDFRPHLIHAHLHEGVLAGWLPAKLLRLPLLFDYQGSLTGESLNHGFFRPGSLLHRCFSALERLITRLPDSTITSSTPGLHELRHQWGVAADRVSPLPDGVDTDVFRPFPREEARNRLADLLGLPALPAEPLIIYLGLLNSYQGIDLLLEAALLLERRSVPFHLVLMGFPDEAYRRRVAELGLDSRVRFTGRIDYNDAPLLLSAGDLAVSPKLSVTEANGKLLNYMACGLATVCFDTPVNRELLAEDGYYAADVSAAALADRLITALADPTTLAETGQQLRQRAVEKHGWDQRGRQLVACYQKLLAPSFP